MATIPTIAIKKASAIFARKLCLTPALSKGEGVLFFKVLSFGEDLGEAIGEIF
jgi:hypothetical protein